MKKPLLFWIISLSITLPLHAQVIEPPPGSPAPASTTSGGSRPIQTCLKSLPKSAQVLTALNPKQRIGFTRSSHPTLFIYLPDNRAKFLELSLFNEHKQGLYQTTISTQNQAGLVRLTIPNDAPNLIKGKNYYWTVAIVCNVSDRTEDQVIDGWIQYRDLSQNPDILLPTERIKLYAKQGFWSDAFLEWSALQQQQPDHPAVKKAWTELIQAIGLPTSLMP